MTSPNPIATTVGTADQIARSAPSAQDEEVRVFVNKLWQLASAEGDAPQVRSRKRAALAALRRGLGKPPGGATEMLPYIVPILPEHLSAWREQAYYLIASLFALYRPETSSAARHNFGVSYLQLAEATASGSVERRFLALLDAPIETLPDHLRHAIGQMAANSHRIAVNWYALLSDLLSWEADNRWVQRKWAKGFYATRRSFDAYEPPAQP